MSEILPFRYLFGPGPGNAYPEVMAALSHPVIGHLDPVFIARLDRVSAGLREVWGTANARTWPVSATGSGGMEAAFVNFVEPGDPVVVAVNGLFGERMCEVARRCGAEVVRVEHEWGQPVDAERVLAAHPSPKIIAAVHAETSTGVRSDIAALGAGKGDALLLADAVTSIGGLELLADEWGVDIGYAGTQKCLGVPPGLSPFTVSERAFERRVREPRSWYFDIGLLGGYVGAAQGRTRTYHHTAPVTMIAGLEAALDRILAEGLPTVWARHEAAGAALREGLEDMGLELFAAEGSRLPSLTTVRVPDGVSSARVRRILLEQYSIEVGSGVGEFADTVWRIGLMGPNANPASVTLALGALGEAIGAAR
ncbi:alanine-glyoxylate transaminase/serine-glyoxylate transaminase/serine-pyruvate transaminase [Sinomonas atrocyanea]|uniref:pyridoxal-phosphate-dependent aminotransferase family protein n=1 Tax=Sinomonas atrocyanea TaxID=37927 RepID=UPI0027846C70|nr:alanine--glyoxylate aminotransferase family protein [Sinomonas atrocyanea]MDP9886262.1 alanine-glyoxylate transaminase/serine-glyoxylate transaminase/serine-pyruvate transaminase [Sinomonas atrocyanea]